jgi:hypothetical protein
VTEQPQTPENEEQVPAAEPAPQPTGPPAAAGAADRPEVAVGAAFAGGFLLAMVLRRLAR